MKKIAAAICLAALCCCPAGAQSYNQLLWIPDTLSGTDFNLTIRDTFAQLVPETESFGCRIFYRN